MGETNYQYLVLGFNKPWQNKFQFWKYDEIEYELFVKCFTNLFQPVFFYVFSETFTEISNSIAKLMHSKVFSL